ncbi:MAG: MoaD/ThiS family protein [Candidatus Omnitrophica bacterium]|nr:MoaD/ThiS family protein [Candidatus Omnitrophota bacterium]
MAIKVRIPAPLQKLTQDKAQVEANGSTISELIEDLNRQFPGFKDRLCDTQGKLRRFINIYLNQEDIRFLKMEVTKTKDGDEISIVPAIAGG